ncbi:prolipoprotein diacylglyceryl transferase [Novosphingobium sp.]|uniref:prolipoprotein diacylglyceryl transferase n=1 Tax=Novosphingobium sp. TaxID=1874826 RepID=UPI00356B3B76
MLSLLSTATALAVASTSAAAATGAVSGPIRWEDLGVSPIALDLGFFALKWYSLAYLAGIILGYWQLSKMISQPGAPIAQRHADDLFFYATLGIILGGRLGYAMFYAPELLTEPQNLIKLWEGGMSFHGGLLGVVLAIAWVSWRAGLNFVRVCDYISVCVPFGLLFGRLANFMNGELWGREAGSGVAWAMIFPGGGPVARHPSQLYEAALEGLVLAIVLLFMFWRTKARWRTGLLVGTFTFGYALARFTVEFYREPDSQLQDFAMRTGFSMGQWLTVPMMAVGLFFLIRGLISKPVSATGAAPA